MSVRGDDDQIAKAKAEELIADIPMIPEVLAIEVQPYTDHTGDPSFEITFRIHKDVEVDKAFMRRFIEFSGVVQTRILHSDLDRFPYTTLDRAA